MGTDRRLVTLLVVLAVVAAPAVALRTFCIGKSCDQASARTAAVPFCGLPEDVRRLITNGFYPDRSPDVLAVTRSTPVAEGVGSRLSVPWPSVDGTVRDQTVPLIFRGSGIRTTTLPDGTGLDQIAPTIEPLLGIRRPHPEVRSGRAIPGVVVRGATTPLVVVIVEKGIGVADFPPGTVVPGDLASRGQWAQQGAEGTAEVGSVPLDPSAVLTTIGSGGLPSEHGITGTTLRGVHGPVRAFANGAPEPVIAALGDDLDRQTNGDAKIGLVGTDVSDRGLIGGTWYGGPDDDTVVRNERDPAAAVTRLLAAGWGDGGAPDLLGVTLTGSWTRMWDASGAITRAVLTAVPDATIVWTSTGHLDARAAVDAAGVARRTEAAVGAPGLTSPGTSGLFVDAGVAASTGVSAQQVADALAAQRAPDGPPLFGDVFPSFAVQFGRYC